MPGIFAKIIAGEIPCYKVAENEHCFAFLDINPLKKGHTLVVPKKEVDDLFDLADPDYIELQKFAKQVALAIKKEITCKRIGVVVLGFEVPHAHLHLIPVNNEGEIDFKNPRVKLDKEEMQEIAERIGKHIS
jgi:histidine triad (HIT) family protein